jgi:hypothetical protein
VGHNLSQKAAPKAFVDAIIALVDGGGGRT